MTSMHLQVAPLQNPERYPLLAQALTDLAERWLGAARETVVVLIDDRPAAQLHISLPAGQAGDGQKTEFITQALKALQRQLGRGEPLAVGSGVIVREVPPQHWGHCESAAAQAQGVA